MHIYVKLLLLILQEIPLEQGKQLMGILICNFISAPLMIPSGVLIRFLELSCICMIGLVNLPIFKN